MVDQRFRLPFSVACILKQPYEINRTSVKIVLSPWSKLEVRVEATDFERSECCSKTEVASSNFGTKEPTDSKEWPFEDGAGEATRFLKGSYFVLCFV